MNSKDQKFIRQWQQLKLKGKLFYALTRGLTWGISVATLSTLFRLGDSSLAELYLSTDFLIKLSIMITGGIFFYGWYWSSNIKKYDKLLSEHPDYLSETNHTAAT